MRTKTIPLGLFMLILLSAEVSLGDYTALPMDSPLVTGAFMEYRGGDTPHFHNGIDIDSGVNQWVYAVLREVTHTRHPADSRGGYLLVSHQRRWGKRGKIYANLH